MSGYSLGGEILNFQRNACLWGRLFSVVEMIGKLFPEMSDFRKIKESADNMYSYMTVSYISNVELKQEIT